MIKGVWSIYDKKAKYYMAPMVLDEISALRFVKGLVLHDANFADFPEDFVLVEISSFDDKLGCFVGVECDGRIEFDSVLPSSTLSPSQEASKGL